MAPYLFVLPNMIIFGLFTIWPAINGFNISLYESSNGRNFDWVGLDNYRRILTDDEFWEVVRNTVVFALAFVLLCLLIATALAVLLQAQGRGKSFFRAVFFLPVLLSPVVVGLVWNWLLERRGGLVNTILTPFGGGDTGWLVESNLAMISVIVVGVWMNVGFYILILLAGLQGIDPSLYEAARMDGAGAWQQLTSLTLPLLQPSLLVVLVLSTIHGFQAFDFIYTLTGGGPVGATTLIVQYIYENGFVSPIRYGLASAGSVLLFVTVFCLTLVNWFIGRRREAV
ncbi:sugar ABC transporter permease [Ruania sp. N2-46]|uniref:Sugar ABC transporter permease n=2 Tax=Occultella gossypii TaxID=2800820 RepID=A0ABS7SFL1_9MICO|nr:sugar ABC transporter permease [Occultella gossypii]